MSAEPTVKKNWKIKTVGVCGLGLIGGSMAKAYRAAGGMRVLGYDRNADTMNAALTEGVLDGELTKETISQCDLLLVALYPAAAAQYLTEMAPQIRSDAMAMDLCGTKVRICETGFSLAGQYGFRFVGGHPMAGTHFSGFDHARANMFFGAPMVLVAQRQEDAERAKELLEPVGFGVYSETTAQEHDRRIAYTSQLAHVVSNAYIKSPTALAHDGFSAGSYRDLTRVAWLNETMWTELFLENRDPLVYEIDTVISSLKQYRDALAAEDAPRLKELLREGRIRKEEVDGL